MRGRYDRAQSPEERKRDQVQRLLDAAVEIFAARGFAGATVELIIERARMSRKTFYEHFEDLRDALLTLVARGADRAFESVEAAVSAESDPIAQLRVGVRAFLSIVAQNAAISRVVFREVRAAGPKFEQHRERILGRYVALLVSRLAAAHERGVLSRPPDELTVYALVAALESVAMRYVSRREEERLVEAAPVLEELVLRAFR
jgi:AcrR family transcriptional regulator